MAVRLAAAACATAVLPGLLATPAGAAGPPGLFLVIGGTICAEQPRSPGSGAPPGGPFDPDVCSVRVIVMGEGQSVAAAGSAAPVPAPVPITFSVSTVDGTATAPADYAAVDRRVTIPAGATGVDIPLRIAADGEPEPEEWFLVTISAPSVGKIGVGTAVVTVRDAGRAGPPA